MFSAKPARLSRSTIVKARPSLAERRSSASGSGSRVYQADKRGGKGSKSSRAWGRRASLGTETTTASHHSTNFSWVNAILLLVGVIAVTAVLWGGWWVVSQLKPWPNPTTLLFVPAQKSDQANAAAFSAVWLWYYPAQQRARVVYFEPNFTVPVAGGYGEYPLNSLWPLLKLDNRSGQFIDAAAGLSLGSPLTKVIPVVPDHVLTTPQAWQDFLWQVAQNRGVANLPPLESWQLGSNLGEVSLANWEVKTEMSGEAWPLARRGLPTVVELGSCSVAVVNTTTSPGLAARLGRVWEDSGLRVVKTADMVPSQPKTTLITEGAEGCATTETVLAQTFPEPPLHRTDSEVTRQYRANIVVMVGEDMAKFWPQ